VEWRLKMNRRSFGLQIQWIGDSKWIDAMLERNFRVVVLKKFRSSVGTQIEWSGGSKCLGVFSKLKLIMYSQNFAWSLNLLRLLLASISNSIWFPFNFRSLKWQNNCVTWCVTYCVTYSVNSQDKSFVHLLFAFF